LFTVDYLSSSWSHALFGDPEPIRIRIEIRIRARENAARTMIAPPWLRSGALHDYTKYCFNSE
jgi:hypothetical protein